MGLNKAINESISSYSTNFSSPVFDKQPFEPGTTAVTILNRRLPCL